MNRSRKVVLLAVFSLVFAGAALGDSMMETCSIGPQSSDFSATPLACNQFDTSGGDTLTEIDITITGMDDGAAISITNNSGDIDPTMSGTITTNYSLDSALAGFSFPTPLFQVVLSVSGTNVANGATVSNSSPLSGSNSTVSGGVDTTNFVPYSGTGLFDIVLDSASLFSDGPLGTTLNSSTSPTVEATATITFDFTTPTGAAPEPGTALLLGIGAVFILFGSRRSKV